MGDRCYVNITIHGPIRTVEQYEKLIEFLVDKGWSANCGSVAKELMTAVITGEEPVFYCDEVNYADTDEEQAFLQSHQIAYYIANDSGSSYGRGCVSWAMGWNSVMQADCDGQGDPCVSLSELIRIRDAGNIDDAIRNLKTANGEGLPGFEAGEEVKKLFSKEIAEYVLGLSTTELETTS